MRSPVVSNLVVLTDHRTVAPHVNDTTLRTGKSTTPRDSGPRLGRVSAGERSAQTRRAIELLHLSAADHFGKAVPFGSYRYYRLGGASVRHGDAVP